MTTPIMIANAKEMKKKRQDSPKTPLGPPPHPPPPAGSSGTSGASSASGSSQSPPPPPPPSNTQGDQSTSTAAPNELEAELVEATSLNGIAVCQGKARRSADFAYWRGRARGDFDVGRRWVSRMVGGTNDTEASTGYGCGGYRADETWSMSCAMTEQIVEMGNIHGPGVQPEQDSRLKFRNEECSATAGSAFAWQGGVADREAQERGVLYTIHLHGMSLISRPINLHTSQGGFAKGRLVLVGANGVVLGGWRGGFSEICAGQDVSIANRVGPHGSGGSSKDGDGDTSFQWSQFTTPCSHLMFLIKDIMTTERPTTQLPQL
ncbi:hypothetical protein Tco_0564011 [Tanacetum coccineum]